MDNSIANLDFVKQRNIAIVFKTIMELYPISRIEIARCCNLSPGSVTRIIRLLVQEGLVQEVEQQASARGRKAILLKPVNSRLYILAARAGRTKLHMGLCDLSGKLVAKESAPLTPKSQQQFGWQVIHSLKTFIEDTNVDRSKIIGVGITTPGLVSSKEGVINYLPHLKVNDFYLADLVTESLKIPCFISNYIAAMALAEFQIGDTIVCKNSLYINIHNGIGASMILDGQLYEGSNLAVGEIGHIQLDPLGSPCYCGNIGCLETVVSNGAIERKCAQLIKSGLPTKLPNQANIETILEYANALDPLAAPLIREAAGNLGKIIAMCVNLLRPERVVIAGEICKSWDIILPILENSLKTQCIQVDGSTTEIIPSKLYESPWYGGYALLRRALLDDGLLWSYLKTINQ